MLQTTLLSVCSTHSVLYPEPQSAIPNIVPNSILVFNGCPPVCRAEAAADAQSEPLLSSFLSSSVLLHGSFEAALSYVLASALSSPLLMTPTLFEIFQVHMCTSCRRHQSVSWKMGAECTCQPAPQHLSFISDHTTEWCDCTHTKVLATKPP